MCRKPDGGLASDLDVLLVPLLLLRQKNTQKQGGPTGRHTKVRRPHSRACKNKSPTEKQARAKAPQKGMQKQGGSAQALLNAAPWEPDVAVDLFISVSVLVPLLCVRKAPQKGMQRQGGSAKP
eukprot:1160826-Pelagomonas_calceolata.AAC.3